MRNTPGCANPDIDRLTDLLLTEAAQPAVAFGPDCRVADSSRQARGEKETEAHEGASGHQAAKWQGDTDHQAVVEPVVEAECAPVEECVIDVERIHQIDGMPVHWQGLYCVELREGVDDILKGKRCYRGVVEHVDGVVGLLETGGGNRAVQGGEQGGQTGNLEKRKQDLHPTGGCGVGGALGGGDVWSENGGSRLPFRHPCRRRLHFLLRRSY
jgi:hypothetical protein